MHYRVQTALPLGGWTIGRRYRTRRAAGKACDRLRAQQPTCFTRIRLFYNDGPCESVRVRLPKVTTRVVNIVIDGKRKILAPE